MADGVLTTSRLVLRRWRAGDLQLLLDHLNTPQVREYLGGVQPAEQVRERFALMEQEWDRVGFSFLAVERQADGLFLGTCGLAPVSGDGVPEPLASGYQIGWQLRPEAWGQGYATEAARAMLGHAFDLLGWQIVYGQTSERNAPSWRVMQRLGMVRRAELDYDDPAYPPMDNPTMVWSLAAEEFFRR